MKRSIKKRQTGFAAASVVAAGTVTQVGRTVRAVVGRIAMYLDPADSERCEVAFR